MRQAGAVIVAAGRGTRMGTAESKQYLLLDGKPIIVHTLEVFQREPLVSEIVLVTGEQDVERCRQWVSSYGLNKVTKVIPGGSERQDSVYKGLQELAAEWVLVHDGVRPFVTGALIHACCEGAWESGASVLAVPVKDTVKVIDGEGFVSATPDRRSLWAIQTPQAFRRLELIEAHEAARRDGFSGTDDSMLVERRGTRVKIVEGDYSNIKITTPEDLDFAAWIRSGRQRRGEDKHD
ncbi:2-C-methyl-D-erythritol 4-phosphate cytidylyltransferase [Paenibacillus yonginensis]|uniref:2-C-methyl-D-erythritol 4-phosphate cytidylyltransferase n=1 Tax=Paenibacillus yonginensis TaxID=1462996 RepID=A0A1B1N778_9BACL|nr:2-C-methyl-D-erythritol 4-phosphate cytidylyltransferase [Paenibacillus yonginensis]ANS77290.1 2-C-methyl-D-erythritol 4-phosphate cytidylyltransferase [Paenibacillus yonginensis]